jgi:hypothetical protein
MALRNEINDFSGALTFKPEWSDVPMNVSEGVGGEGGALNLQAEALGNRSEINKITSREALRRSYAEAGYNLVVGSFEAGGTLVNANDVLLQERTGKAFSGPAGTVAAGTNPASGGFVDKSGGLLRHELATSDGAAKVGNANGGSVQDFIDKAENGDLTVIADGSITPRRLGERFADVVNVKDFGAKGDYYLTDGSVNPNATDDTAAIQAALDAQYVNRAEIYFPAGGYKTTKPLHMWSSYYAAAPISPTITGDGKGVTKIIKTTQTKSTLVNHTHVDAILIIANEWSKKGNPITVHTNGEQTCCFKVRVRGMDFESENKSTSRVDSAIWSYGLYFCEFENVGCTWTNNGMYVQYWNCGNRYYRMEMERLRTAYAFGNTVFGSVTTLNFEDCHCNGVDVLCYDILGGAILKNCAIDGGGGTHIRIKGFDRGPAGILGGKVIMDRCHHESPAIFGSNHMFDLTYGTVYVNNSSIEVPYLNTNSESALIKLSRFSEITFNNQNFGFRAGATPHRGSFYKLTSNIIGISDNDFTCSVKLQGDTQINTEAFDNYQPLPNPAIYIIANRGKIINSASVNQFIQYTSSSNPYRNTVGYAVTPTNRSILTVVQDPSGVGSTAMGICFKVPVDLTDKTRIELAGTLAGSKGLIEIGFTPAAVADRGVGNGVPLVADNIPMVGRYASNNDATDAVWYSDVTNRTGMHYISLIFNISFAGKLEVQELRVV